MCFTFSTREDSIPFGFLNTVGCGYSIQLELHYLIAFVIETLEAVLMAGQSDRGQHKEWTPFNPPLALGMFP
jgi:hypothetical protein